jgi:hypothetical protein
VRGFVCSASQYTTITFAGPGRCARASALLRRGRIAHGAGWAPGSRWAEPHALRASRRRRPPGWRRPFPLATGGRRWAGRPPHDIERQPRH